MNATAALRDAQQAASECPNDVNGWLNAARAYNALERASGVERVYRQALDSNPQDLRVVRAYADWLLRNERKREAVAIVRRLTRNSPASLSAWRYYEQVCRSAEESCAAEAARGLVDAQTRFGVDLEPGTLAPNGLFGRFVSR
jgi:predicted Zn-dependent protease